MNQHASLKAFAAGRLLGLALTASPSAGKIGGPPPSDASNSPAATTAPC